MGNDRATVRLSSHQLEAFVTLAKFLHFSKAADALHLTQSALSQRIKNLEVELGTTLFIREPSGVRLTEVAQRLLRYCQVKDSLEDEFLSTLKEKNSGALAGNLRIAGYSSVMRSVVLPVLAPLLREHPNVQFDFMSREMIELPQILQRGEADYILLDHHWERDGVSAQLLGHEEIVLIESEKFKSRASTYLDHDAHDLATAQFFKGQRQSESYHRSFLDDVYGILDGVSLGIGRAVMSRHLVPKEFKVKVVSGYKATKVPVSLYFHEQPYYSRLHQLVVKSLLGNCRKYLGS